MKRTEKNIVFLMIMIPIFNMTYFTKVSMTSLSNDEQNGFRKVNKIINCENNYLQL